MTERLMGRLLGFVLGLLEWNDPAILQIAVYRGNATCFLSAATMGVKGAKPP